MNDDHKIHVEELSDVLIKATFSYVRKHFPEKLRLDDALNILTSGFLSAMQHVVESPVNHTEETMKQIMKKFKILHDIFNVKIEILEDKYH